MSLPGALFLPSPLLLPGDCLLLRALRLLLLRLSLRLLGWLLALRLRGLSALLLRRLRGLSLLLLGPLRLRLLGRLLALRLRGLSALLLLRLCLRALLLCGRGTLLWLTLLPVVFLLPRVGRNNRPENQKQGSGSGRSIESHGWPPIVFPWSRE
jgi:hypothetical protein